MGVFANVSQQSQNPNGSGGVFSRVAQDPRNLAISQGQAVGTQKRYERTGKVGPSFGGQVVRGIVKPFARLGTNAVQAAQIRKNPNAQPFSGNFLGEVKAVGQSGNFGKDILDSIGVGAEIGSNFIGGGGAASAVKAGAKGLIKQGIKTGAKTGFQAGTAYGFGAGLQDQEDKNIGQILGNTAIQTIKGAVAGTATGTALGGVTGLIAKPSALLPKGENIMNRVARLTPRQAQKFKEMSGVSHGQYLKETGNFGTPKEIIEKEAQKFANSMKTADSALETLQGTFKPEPVGTAINDLVEREVRVSAPGAPSQDLERTIFLKKKFMEQGLTMPEINEAKRLYERNIRMDFVKQNLPEGIARATNIDNALRKWQFAKADELGLKNLPEINKQTRLSKFIVDNLGKQINGKVGNNGITLTDWIILSNGDPTAIGAFLTKKAVLNNRIQSRIAKAVSKKPTKGEVKAIFGNKVDEATQTTRKTTPQPKLSPTVSERSYTNTVLPKSSPVNPPANLKAQKIAPPSKIPSKVSISKSVAPKKLPSKPIAKTDSLLQEAKKYKSAEEFVNTSTELTYKNLQENPYSIKAYGKDFNEPVEYHRAGTIKKNGDIWLTDNPAGASQYSSAGGGTKTGSYVVQSKNPLIIDTAGGKYANGNIDINKILTKEEVAQGYTNNPTTKQKFIDYAKKNGYDAVQFADSFPDGEGGMRSLVVWNKDQIQTKSQLTDIWNKANKPKLSLKDNRGFIASGYKNEGNLTTKILKDLEGKTTVSKQYILDATNRGELKQVERDITRQVLEDMTSKNPTGARSVSSFSDLPRTVKEDLASEIYDSASPQYNFSARHGAEDILNALEDHKISVGKENVDNLLKQFSGQNRGTSEIAVENLKKVLKQKGELDPIIVNGSELVDGGHRIMAYKALGKKEIPVIDIAEIYKTLNENPAYILDPYEYGLKSYNKPKSSSDTINVKEFADKVKSELLPLKVETKKFSKNGGSSTGSTKYESIALPDDLRGNVANYKENIYESPIATSAGDVHFAGKAKNYFGHTRIEDMADNKTRRVIEVQSDLYQKGNLERELDTPERVLNSKEFAELKMLHNKTNTLKNTFEMSNLDNYTKEIENIAEREKVLIDKLKYAPTDRELSNSKLQQYNDPTAHFRMVREEIKKASQDGKTKLQFPTGETAMKIEGLGDNNRWTIRDGSLRDGVRALNNVTPEKIKVGETIFQGNDMSGWIITDVLGDGKFVAASKRDIDMAIKDSGKSFKKLLDSGEINEWGINGEEFDISGKVDTNNPIYKFYEKDVQKYLNKFGGKRVVDDKGVTWIEIPITKDMGDAPVEAFGKIGMSPLFVGAGLGLAGVATAGTIKKKSIYKNGK